MIIPFPVISEEEKQRVLNLKQQSELEQQRVIIEQLKERTKKEAQKK
tara:strand:- start:1131 stop:1271 length:141 start_codon:yes stop_codon:yes gene_type:complete